MKNLFALIFVISVSACSSTVINSTPNGATLYMNGEKVGITPYTYTDKKILGSTNTVRLQKDGYQDFSAEFSRNESVSVLAIIGSPFILPVLWIMDYKPTHSYELVLQNSATNK